MIDGMSNFFSGMFGAGKSLGLPSSGGLFSKSSLMSAGSFGSDLMSMYSSIQAGKYGQKLYQAQARQENLMARQVEINAEEQANSVREQLLNDMASASAFFAAYGMSGSGTALNAQIASRRNAVKDISALNRAASINALFMRGQATQTQFEGQATRVRGRMEAINKLPSLAKSGSSLYGAIGGLFG